MLVGVDLVVAAVRRSAARLPVRWPRHAGRGRHDLRRLRATRLLRARRARPAWPAASSSRLELTVVRRPRAYVALAVGLVGLTVVVLASAALRLAALPGRLRLDRAAAVRRRVDRGDGRHPRACWPSCWPADRTRWLGQAMAVIGAGLAHRAQRAGPGGVRGRAQRRPGHRPEPRAGRWLGRPRRRVPGRPARRCRPGPRRGAAALPGARAEPRPGGLLARRQASSPRTRR